jgi:hypothetical protein
MILSVVTHVIHVIHHLNVTNICGLRALLEEDSCIHGMVPLLFSLTTIMLNEMLSLATALSVIDTSFHLLSCSHLSLINTEIIHHLNIYSYNFISK